MAKFVRLERGGAAAVAWQVLAEMKKGLAVVPMLGGYCVIAADPAKSAAFGCSFAPAHRLLRKEGDLDIEPGQLGDSERAAVLSVLAGPAVGRFGEPSGSALPDDEFSRELARQAGGPIFFGLPDEGTAPGELADDLGRDAAIVVTGGQGFELGPTVVDFSTSPATIDRRGKLAILDIERELGRLVRLGPDLAFSVLVVCTGNSCRSPMAAGILGKLLAGERVFIFSAGTNAPVGNTATLAALEAVRGLGVDMARHRAQQLTREMVLRADLVLVMDDYHRERVLAELPEAACRTRLLLEYAGKPGAEVEDPVGRSLEFYERTVAVMMPALERAAAEIKQRLGR